MPRLTKSFVDRAELPTAGQRFEWDSDLKGFGLRITAGGKKTYIVQGRIGKASKRISIASHGVMTADEARAEARQLLASMAREVDPTIQKGARANSPTISFLADHYLENHALPRKKKKSVEGDLSMLRSKILPAFGTRKVWDLGVNDIQALMADLRDKPYAANRVRALLSKMLSLAVDWGWRNDNPVEKVMRYPERPRLRWLTDDEIGSLLAALERYPYRPAADALRFILLTGARKSEVLQAEWRQFDLKHGVWIKPRTNTKQDRDERVPLSVPALDLLGEIERSASKDERWVFPGARQGTRMHDLKIPWGRISREAGLEGVRIHDLRHTFASHLASSGQSLLVIGKLLGHSQPQTTARYAHLADRPLKEAVNAFGDLYSRASKRAHEQDHGGDHLDEG